MNRFTIDANILIYAAQSLDRRHHLALAILRGAAQSGNAVLTVQALGEFFHVASRKGVMSRPNAAAQVERWMTLFPLIPTPGPAQLEAAMAASAAGRFDFWDAMLLATADAAGCLALISEDMAPGTRLGATQVVRAFAGTEVSPEPHSLLA